MPPKMLRKWYTRGWCDRSWSMLALFGTLQEELEKVQTRTARFVTGNYNTETGSMKHS